MPPARKRAGRRPAPGAAGSAARRAFALVTLRIIVVAPVPRVRLAVQQGRDELLPPASSSRAETRFDFTAEVAHTGDGVRWRGPVVQGPAAGRFVYVNAGLRAGQPDSCWDRRAKVPLHGITPALVAVARTTSDCVLTARMAGQARDGGPACATVPLLDGGWILRRGDQALP